MGYTLCVSSLVLAKTCVGSLVFENEPTMKKIIGSQKMIAGTVEDIWKHKDMKIGMQKHMETKHMVAVTDFTMTRNFATEMTQHGKTTANGIFVHKMHGTQIMGGDEQTNQCSEHPLPSKLMQGSLRLKGATMIGNFPTQGAQQKFRMPN